LQQQQQQQGHQTHAGPVHNAAWVVAHLSMQLQYMETQVAFRASTPSRSLLGTPSGPTWHSRPPGSAYPQAA
jgi:hypothetical protein